MILSGKKVRNVLRESLDSRIQTLSKKPHLLIISVGERADSMMYIQAKKAYGESLGITVSQASLATDVSQDDVIKVVQTANQDEDIDGIICQLPFPAHIDAHTVIDTINASKDTDALSHTYVEALAQGNTSFIPATTRGIIALLNFYALSLQDKKVTVIGRSQLVGTPTARACEAYGAIVTVAHSQTPSIADAVRDADIIISATGQKNLITKEMVHKDQIIIDVGINKDGENQIRGDVAGDVAEIVAGCTPVPGGVGPMTVHSLFENLVDLVQKRNVV